MRMTAGIVTRTKDRGVLLHRALASVKAQSHKRWRLVVVNDGGEPEPVNTAVSDVFAGDRRVEIIHNGTSLGMEAASNAGLARLDTDTAVIHDDDDSWDPRFLELSLRTLNEKSAELPTVRGVATGINAVYETVGDGPPSIDSVEPWQSDPERPLTPGILDLVRMLERNCFPPIAFLYDLPAARDLGLYDESLPVLGDWEFHSRFAMAYDIWVLSEPLANYHFRLGATGAMGNTVIAGVDRHKLFSQILSNRWLREQLVANPGGRSVLSLLGTLKSRSDSVIARVERLEQKIEDSTRKPRRYWLFGPRS
jgi:glycosyltransferase involved in cell wall biosynthesis